MRFLLRDIKSKIRRLLFFTSLTLAFGLFLQTATFAQIDSKEIEEEMEKATKELQEQLKNFNFEDFQMDTLLLKNFKFPEGLDMENFVMPNDIDMNEMLKMMERQMQQVDMEGMLKMMQENFSKMDFSEMEKMMEPFMNGEMFIIPSPENLERKGGEEKQEEQPKKKAKKKKTYKM